MNDFEHLQSIYRFIHNQQVNDFFRDVGDIDENLEDVRNLPPRASLKKACLIVDNDSSSVLALRIQLFDKIKGNEAIIYSNIDKLSVRRAHKPKVVLHFLEDLDDVEEGYSPIEGEIGFRLMNAGSDDDISSAEAKHLGTKIKAIFGASNGFVWRKGKEMVCYADWQKGYQIQLLCRDKAEGKRVIERVLEIQEHSPDWENLTHTTNEEPSQRYPTLPPQKTVLGKVQRMNRERPIGNVRFTFASLIIRGMQNPQVLYSRSGQSRNALVE